MLSLLALCIIWTSAGTAMYLTFVLLLVRVDFGVALADARSGEQQLVL